MSAIAAVIAVQMLALWGTARKLWTKWKWVSGGRVHCLLTGISGTKGSKEEEAREQESKPNDQNGYNSFNSTDLPRDWP